MPTPEHYYISSSSKSKYFIIPEHYLDRVFYLQGAFVHQILLQGKQIVSLFVGKDLVERPHIKLPFWKAPFHALFNVSYDVTTFNKWLELIRALEKMISDTIVKFNASNSMFTFTFSKFVSKAIK
jgi:hypothetical protein